MPTLDDAVWLVMGRAGLVLVSLGLALSAVLWLNWFAVFL